jgi:hypothetical protein
MPTLRAGAVPRRIAANHSKSVSRLMFAGRAVHQHVRAGAGSHHFARSGPCRLMPIPAVLMQAVLMQAVLMQAVLMQAVRMHAMRMQAMPTQAVFAQGVPTVAPIPGLVMACSPRASRSSGTTR